MQPQQVITQSVFGRRMPHRVNSVTDKLYSSKCPVCGETGHTAAMACAHFKGKDEHTRWNIAKGKQLCFRCLMYRNNAHRCGIKLCGVNGCKYTHHKLLHTNRKSEASGSEITEMITSTWTPNKKQSFLKIVPVQIEGSKAIIDTYALLDDGSTVTLIDDSVADRIGARGPVDPLRIQTVNSQRTAETASRRVNFKIKGASGFNDKIEARTVRNL